MVAIILHTPQPPPIGPTTRVSHDQPTMQPCVYILTNGKNGTIYIGVTGNLLRRMEAHRDGWEQGFTSRYTCRKLVHVEHFECIADAIEREKQLKRWRRAWKIALIESRNPQWRDLCLDFLD